ncbi:hypothetical protein FALCPG4_004153 [Fusarium falciforme]
MDTTIEDPISPLYSEVPLDASHREIRILTLHAGKWEDPIRCDLSSTSLDSNPDFQALSYSWGTDLTTVDITVNDWPFPVRENLRTILQRLRRPVLGENLVLWVDAICINQSKSSAHANAERSSQVSMMATIYSRCREVLVWLGHCYLDRKQSLRFLSLGRGNKELLLEYANDFRRDPRKLDYCFHLACFFFLLKDVGTQVNYDRYELPPFWGTGHRHILSRLPQYGIPPTTEAFKEFYAQRMCVMLKYVSESTWATRMWTLQEFATAPKVTICFGTAAVPLETFVRVTDIHGDGGDSGDSDDGEDGRAFWSREFSNRFGSLVYAFHRHTTLRNAMATTWPWARLNRYLGPLLSQFTPSPLWILRRMARRSSTTIFELVAAFRDSEATDAHDKVYAVMSFMSFVGIPLPMEIDYAIPVKKVYINVCSNQILTCKNESAAYEPLAPLRFSRHKNKYKTSPDKNKGRPLPSWVVDWTSYPWNDNDIIPIPTRTRKLSPEIVPWLQIKPCKDLDQDDRTVEHPTRMIGATRYNATKGIKGNPPSISTDHILTVSGMAIGTVREVALVSRHAAWKLARAGEGASDKERRDRRAMVLRTLAADMLDQPVDWARIGEFWVSLLEALEVAEMRLGEETNNGMRMGPTFFEDVAMRAGKTIRTRYERSEEMTTDNLDAAFVERLGELIRWIGLMSKGNSLFATSSGHIGLGGNEISVEDMVYVLHEGRTPFVLRPIPDSELRFQVISECYIDGLMYGEAKHMKIELQRIEIE